MTFELRDPYEATIDEFSDESARYREEMEQLEAIEKRISSKLEAWKQYVRDEYKKGPESKRQRSDEELVWRPLEKQRRGSNKLCETIKAQWDQNRPDVTTDTCFIPMILLDSAIRDNDAERAMR